jgi:hypothetical protein
MRETSSTKLRGTTFVTGLTGLHHQKSYIKYNVYTFWMIENEIARIKKYLEDSFQDAQPRWYTIAHAES